ncbi:MAG: hypothetical protein KAR39_13270 [Thermoplasmata archaeon]|nr:hypothetical protein [Thermoplasmata archaeon]
MSVTSGDILRIVASMLWTDGNVNQNIFNAVVTGGGSPWSDTDIVDDAEAWLDNMYANVTTICSDEVDGNEVVVYKYDAIDDDWDEVGSQSWTWNPSNTSEQLPRGVAFLMRLWTTDPDVQGKKYLPATCESNLLDGLYGSGISTAGLAFAADWYNPFTGGVSGATWTPGIWSVVGTVFKAAVDHIAVSLIPAYQRRRKRNVGI